MGVDRRIRKTRTALKDAVLALASQRNLDEISVQDIVDQADVSRATFYSHYKSKEDLVTEALDSLFETFVTEAAEFRKTPVDFHPDVVPPNLVIALRRMGDNPDLFVRLFGDRGAGAWMVRLRTFWEEQFLETWHASDFEPCEGAMPVELRASFAASIMARVVSWWLDGHRDEPVERIARWHWDFVSHLWFDHTFRTANQGDIVEQGSGRRSDDGSVAASR